MGPKLRDPPVVKFIVCIAQVLVSMLFTVGICMGWKQFHHRISSARPPAASSVVAFGMFANGNV